MSREMMVTTTPWLGDIPTEWGVERCKYNFIYHKDVAKNRASDYERLALTMKGVIKRSKDDLDGLQPKDFEGYQIVNKGDLVFKLIDLAGVSTSRVGLSAYDGLVSPAYILMHADESKISKEYAAYFFLSMWHRLIFNEIGNGGIRSSLNSGDLLEVPITKPPISEQKAIVRYLDSKCSAIDEAIERHKKIIEKLEEYRKAEISKSVTVGMDNNVPMKHSGNKCIGNIPSHWGCCKILYVLSMPITDGPHETPTAVDDGVPFISAEAVSQGNGRIDFDHMWGYISQDFYEQCCKKYIPQRDDIYMIKSGATTGKVAIVDTDRVFTIWSPLAVLRVDKAKMIAKYLFYYVQSTGYQQQVELGWNYGTQQNIGMRMVERLKVCVPTLEEQRLITEHLDKVWERVNSAIDRENTIISKLEEYRKSIIYNAVTGKIDCREA